MTASKAGSPDLRPFILDLEYQELANHLETWSEPAYRLQQIWEGLYRHFWQDAGQFHVLPTSLRRRLSDKFTFSRLQPLSELSSSDGQTIKTLFRLPDNSSIEAVLMKYKKRRTLCISSQAGCAMGCVFCATGHMGLQKNLSSGEIIQQVLYYASRLQLVGEKISNVVVMGMGEPFNNYDSTLSAVNRLNHRQGFNFGSRRFTISTVGLVPFIRRFTQEKHQINLAVSLHAADDELRSSMMPVNKRYPLKMLFEACLEYTRQTHRRISFEWALIEGVNDSLSQADKLCQWLAPFRLGGTILCHVNLIPLNPTYQYSGKPSNQQQALRFKEFLTSRAIPCTIRLRRGIDIQAGCGQLAVQTQPTKPL